MRVTGLRLGDADALPKAAVAMGSTLAAACTIGFAFLLALRLSGSVRRSIGAAALLGFGTLLWPYSKFGFNAALTACALAAGVHGIAAAGMTRRCGPAVAGGCGLAVALLTRHEMTIAAAICLAWLWWLERKHTHWRVFLAAAGPVALAVAASVALNWVRFGDPLWSGHRPAFSGAGFAGYLLSPAGALLLYSPPALAALALLPGIRRREPVPLLMLSTAVVLIVFYAALEDWLGTRSYGPRYLVPLLPLLVAPLSLVGWPASRLRRALLVSACALSVAIQLPAVLVDFSRAGIAAHMPPQPLRRFDWSWVPVVVNTRYAVDILRTPEAPDADSLLPPGDASALSTRAPRSLDFWWLYLYHFDVWPGWAAAAAGLLPLVAAVYLFNTLYPRTSS
jgi:hypothetical protein